MASKVMRWILALLFLIQGWVLNAKPLSIHVQDRKDYEVLDLFFKMGIQEEEYGYVLEGVKPISARQFYALDVFPMREMRFSEDEWRKTLLVREAIPVWKRLCSQQDRFVLKAIPVIECEADACGYEVQFIYIPKLREVIAENIHLFRYVLGPNVEIEELVHKLAYSSERFFDVLQNDLTLTGIVLGFGSHNSVVGGRLETIDRSSISKDNAPFLPKSALLQDEASWSMYGMYYLEYAGGNDSLFRQSVSAMGPGFGFNTLQDEVITLQSKAEELPKVLQDQPRFIFGAFKGGRSNRSLFQTLQKTQMRIKSLLHDDRRLTKVLERIGGRKPRISCDRSPVEKSAWSLIDDVEALWFSVLKGAMQRFTDLQDQQRFRDALVNSSSQPTLPPMMGASREMLRGWSQARDNLTNAQKQFECLSEDATAQAVIPRQLYVKTVQQGLGEKVEGVSRLRLNYVIEDGAGNVLFANSDTWINLAETIQGFAHGLQGMCIGEKRTLYIHPALGYGALTTLPPCTVLVAHVQLLDVERNTKFILPDVKPIEFEWLHNQRTYNDIKESIELLPVYMGAFYKKLLGQMKHF
jgi:FKBP-type peptidyl-prolyl cis-trans isomerase